ncbi:unnamed protein product [Paramecium octaurelia]|uniref:Tubulin-tyrosine ligase family protein n=1 Tax=Paramecium octaurelia TaxID=43137 RepID=A0A8S1WRA7_PAROT|nr:unnamed protein product [Paramecium octaurelia]
MSDSENEQQRKVVLPQIIMNVYDTQYQVVRYVGQEILKWKLIAEPESWDWDVYWTDSGVHAEMLSKMKQHQKVNHFPGMYILARKNNLGKQLTKMRRRFPKEFKFFPYTWMLPSDSQDLREYMKGKGRDEILIVKPEASCQGRGIFLTKSLDFISPAERYVVQKYLGDPFLIDGLKFDFRIYVLVAGCDPLRIFIYTEGLARFATEKYMPPHPSNFDDLCMHLTNYAINKNNENFVFNEDVQRMDVGHKRSMSSVFEKLKQEGRDIDQLWMDIKQIIIKTLCSAQPFLKHQYTTSQPNNLMNNMCFEILGFDIILDNSFTPILLEINHSPSFTTDSPLDQYIKANLIEDTLVLMNVNREEKYRLIQEKHQEMQKRILTGRNIRMTQEDRKAIVEQYQLIRDAYEDEHLGGFEKIYPCDEEYETDYYTQFLNYASDIFEESTGTKKIQLPPSRKITGSPQKSIKHDAAKIYAQPLRVVVQSQQVQSRKTKQHTLLYKSMIQSQIQQEQRKIQIMMKQREQLQQKQKYIQ